MMSNARRIPFAPRAACALALAWLHRESLNIRDRAQLVAFAGPRYPAPSLDAEHLTALPRISLNGNFQRPRYAKVLISGAATGLWNGFRRLNVA